MNGHVAKKASAKSRTGFMYYPVVELDADPVTGKRARRWHPGHVLKADAQEALRKLQDDADKGTYVAPVKETFGEYLERWLPTIRTTVRANTYESYRSAVEVHLIPRIGHLQLRQLNRGTFSTLYAELSETGRADGRGGLSPRSVRAVHVTAHKALKDAVKDNLLARNPTDDANVPAKVRSQTPSWTAEQVGAFLTSARSNRLYPAFLTTATTGLRRSELLGLRWADIDLDAGSLKVRQVVTLDKYEPFLAEPKTARSRRVLALDGGTVTALRARRQAQREERVAAGPAWQQTELVFAKADGAILHPQTLSGAFERAAKKAGLPPIGIHGLRHSHASLGLANNVPLVTMSERLGHSSVAITDDVYSHSLPSQHQEAADAIAGLIAGGSV
jgi:integrase